MEMVLDVFGSSEEIKFTTDPVILIVDSSVSDGSTVPWLSAQR